MGLHVSPLLRAKKRSRENETGNGFECTNQILESPSLQNGDGASGSISSPEGKMGGVFGLPGGLLANACPPSVLPFSSTPDGEGDILIHQSPVQHLACLKSLHKAGEGSRHLPCGSWSLHPHVPRKIGGCSKQCLSSAESVGSHGIQVILDKAVLTTTHMLCWLRMEWDMVNSILSLDTDSALHMLCCIRLVFFQHCEQDPSTSRPRPSH